MLLSKDTMMLQLTLKVFMLKNTMMEDMCSQPTKSQILTLSAQLSKQITRNYLFQSVAVLLMIQHTAIGQNTKTNM